MAYMVCSNPGDVTFAQADQDDPIEEEEDEEHGHIQMLAKAHLDHCRPRCRQQVGIACSAETCLMRILGGKPFQSYLP